MSCVLGLPKALTALIQASSSISIALVAHLCDIRGKTDCTAAPPAGVHATLRNLVHVTQDLGLADSRVAHQKHVELTPHASTLKLLHQPGALWAGPACRTTLIRSPTGGSSYNCSTGAAH